MARKKKKKNWPRILIGTLVVLGTLWFLTPDDARFKHANVWQSMTSPGALSKSHAFLENNCAACHTPVKGVEPANCIVCHANNTNLLKRQPTAFHAHVTSCKECHIEHEGKNTPPVAMDHAAMVKIGTRALGRNKDPQSSDQIALANLKYWAQRYDNSVEHLQTKPEVKLLNCYICHQNDDQHFKLFGQDCAQCHGVQQWTLPQYQHPSTSSRDCAQCHQAPPSHYMMHFGMISQKVAGKHKAKVNECFACHQTTSWPDIKGVGWYKHH